MAKDRETSTDRDLYSGLIRLHILYHACQEPIFGLGIMVLLLLTLVRGDLLETWQQRLPPDAPNFFLINVQADDVVAMGDYLSRHGLAGSGLYPMVRGRKSVQRFGVENRVDQQIKGRVRNQHVADKKYQIEQEMIFLDVSDFVGNNGINFFRFQ